MENRPKISVIVPVYNVERYLHRCIDSILAQTFTDFELLLIDDGSKDQSGKICDEYTVKDKRIIVFHKENAGVSSARNLGLDNASGEWIVFCDSDDEMFPNALEEYCNIISVNSGLQLISCGYMIFNKSGRINEMTYPDMMIDDSEMMLYHSEVSHYCGFLWNKCVKAYLAKQFRFDETISWLEDHLYMYECMLHSKKIFISSAVLYKYYYDDCEIKGRGKGLSNRLSNYNEIIRAAILERELKKKFLKSNNENLNAIINTSYESKIHFAVYSAIMGGGSVC